MSIKGKYRGPVSSFMTNDNQHPDYTPVPLLCRTFHLGGPQQRLRGTLCGTSSNRRWVYSYFKITVLIENVVEIFGEKNEI